MGIDRMRYGYERLVRKMLAMLTKEEGKERIKVKKNQE